MSRDNYDPLRDPISPSASAGCSMLPCLGVSPTSVCLRLIKLSLPSSLGIGVACLESFTSIGVPAGVPALDD
jgi:hypothetical protein